MRTWMLSMITNYIKEAKGLSKSEKLELYDLISNAIRTTRTFISRTRNTEKDEPSNILSTTWQRAANELQKVGNARLKDFARTLEEKSKYWADPKAYDKDELNKYGMMLTQVEERLKELTK